MRTEWQVLAGVLLAASLLVWLWQSALRVNAVLLGPSWPLAWLRPQTWLG